MRTASKGLSARDETGYTLIELTVVLAILGVVLGVLVAVFISATNTEVDQTARATTEQNARVALDQMRRDIHCAQNVYVAAGGNKLTLNEGTNQCALGATSGWVTWCTTQVATSDGSSRYVLRRTTAVNIAVPPSGPCTASSLFRADYITNPAVWPSYNCTAGSGRNPSVSVDLRVNQTPIKTPNRSYRLDGCDRATQRRPLLTGRLRNDV